MRETLHSGGKGKGFEFDQPTLDMQRDFIYER